MRNWIVGIFLGVFASSALGAERYVNVATGYDGYAGTASNPYRTIQKCVDTAVAGDTCFIAPGVYRETVTSKHNGTSSSPIRVVAQPGGDVVISATDKVITWALHSGNIYKSTVGSKVHQLFVLPGIPGASFYRFSLDPSIEPNELMTEARYPNAGATTDGLFEKTEDNHFTTISKSGSLGLTVTGLPAGNYANAHVYAYGGPSDRRWWSNTAKVASNTGNVLTTSTNMDGWINTTGGAGAAGGNGSYDGYVYGVLPVLDQAKEWSSDGNLLHFWAEGNVNPSSLNVEAKTRLYVLKIDHDYINLEGIKTFAGSTILNGDNITLDSMDLRYVNSTKHVQAGTQSSNGSVWSWPYTTVAASADPVSGVRFQGNHNRLRNSNVFYSMGEGITLSGDNNTVENNYVRYTNYLGHYSHAVQIVGDDNSVIGNTMSHTGRSLVRLHHTPSAERWRVNYNDVSHNALVNHDVGLITAWGNDANGGEIAYNWVHEMGPKSFGIYMDSNNSEILIHHNVVWSGYTGVSVILLPPQEKVYMYNNTVLSGMQKGWHNSATGPNRFTMVQSYNNYYAGTYDFGGYAVGSCCNVAAGNGNWTRMPTADITLNSWSEAKDRGFPIGQTVYSGKTFPSVTQYASGTPDAGAYENGGRSWRPGVDRVENAVGSAPTKSAFHRIPAADFDAQSGVLVENVSGVVNIGAIQNGDWTRYENVEFGTGTISGVEVTAASNTNGGTIEIRDGGVVGALIGSCSIAGTGGWQTYETTTCTGLQNIAGLHNVVLVFKGTGNLVNVDSIKFTQRTTNTRDARSRIEAESFDLQSGIRIERKDNTTVNNIGYIQNGEWAKFENVDFRFSLASKFIVRASSNNSGGNIEIRLDSIDGALLGTCAISGTGNWSTYVTTTCTGLPYAGGERDVYLKFTGTGDLFNVDWFYFAD